MIKTAATVIAAAALATAASAQDATFSIDTTVNGNTVDVSVEVSVANLGAGAIAGYGLDLAITAGAATGPFAPAVSPVLTTGTLPGDNSVDGSLTRVVGGQVSNIFGANPSVDTSSSMVLFTTSFPADADLTLELSSAANGGFLVYSDANGGANAPAATTNLPLSVDVTFATTAPCPADTDGNGVINGLDFNAVLSAFGTSTGDAGFNAAADTDGNGAINGLDFNAILSAFGTSCP